MHELIHKRSGQVLVGVVLLLVLMATMVPLMVLYVQREAKWTVKQDQSSSAFHMAEAGVEKAFRALSVSTETWYALVEEGTQIDNFKFDHEFSDLDNGTYAVSITSGPEARQATVISIGRDTLAKEVRSLKAIFGQNVLGNVAIHAINGVTMSGNNVQVDWGAIISPETIDPQSRDYPQFWSSAGLTGFDTDPNPPNCDSPNCWQWFAYSPDVPPDPLVDLNFYRSSAQATTAGCPSGGVDYGSGGSCYFSGNTTFGSNFTYSGGSTIFVEGDLDVSAHITVHGALIVTGDMTLPNGRWGNDNCTMVMPQTAWRQYGNNWAAYDFGDGTKPAAFPGLDSSYLSAQGLTYNETKCGVLGFMYIGEDFAESGGGGNTVIYGTMLVQGHVTLDMNSQFRIYYNEDAAENIRSKRLVLTRVSWQGIVRQWPL
jgi:hypothetical protein